MLGLAAFVLLYSVLVNDPSRGGFGGGVGFGVFGFFLVLLLIFFIVRVAFWGVRSSYRAGPRYGGGDPARAIARRRYARGEITREQYEQIVRDLGP